MTKRSPEEVGRLVRQRREWLGLTQEGCGISSSLVKQIEAGTAPDGGRGGKRSIFMRALRWPPDALDKLAAGADPDELEAAAVEGVPPWEELLEGQRRLTEAVERIADRLEADT